MLAASSHPKALETDGPFINRGDSEANWCGDVENACPACGGSGHKDDADLLRAQVLSQDALLQAENERLRAALTRIKARDSSIDATIRSGSSGRTIAMGDFARIADAALRDAQGGE